MAEIVRAISFKLLQEGFVLLYLRKYYLQIYMVSS